MTLRHLARQAGIDPDCWYPACWSSELPPGSVRPVTLWKKSFAVFRGEDGTLGALHDRCAHRPVPLSLGHVERCRLVCPYHGWTYDAGGQLTSIPHDRFGKRLPTLRVPSLAVTERYGLVWISPRGNDPATLPAIAPLEASPPWPQVTLDERWNAHHSAVIDNVLDLTHAHLHRRFQPFVDPHLESWDETSTTVRARYRTTVGSAPTLRPFLGKHVDLSRMTMEYIYPHHRSNTGDYVRHWTLLRPIDEATTHVYIIFVVKHARLPGIGRAPAWIVERGLRLLRQWYIKPLLAEDRMVLEAEQEHEDAGSSPELNPVVRACHRLTVARAA
ncbi:MAG: aromatic ring-hydroxylating dioxygenase subunit alpha [Myxococcota bacterium]